MKSLVPIQIASCYRLYASVRHARDGIYLELTPEELVYDYEFNNSFLERHSDAVMEALESLGALIDEK